MSTSCVIPSIYYTQCGTWLESSHQQLPTYFSTANKLHHIPRLTFSENWLPPSSIFSSIIWCPYFPNICPPICRSVSYVNPITHTACRTACWTVLHSALPQNTELSAFWNGGVPVSIVCTTVHSSTDVNFNVDWLSCFLWIPDQSSECDFLIKRTF